MRTFPEGALGDEGEWRLLVTRLNSVPSYLAVARTNLDAGRRSGNIPDRRLVQRDGIAGSKANAAYFRTSLPALAKAYLGSRNFAGSMLAGVVGAGEAAAHAYVDFASWLERSFPLKGPCRAKVRFPEARCPAAVGPACRDEGRDVEG